MKQRSSRHARVGQANGQVGQANGQVGQARGQAGQALVEWALSIVVILGVFFVINRSVMRGIGKMWISMAKQVAAPCPTCTPPDQLQQ